MPPRSSATNGTKRLQKRDLAVLEVFSAVRFIDTATLSAILTPDPFPNHQRLRLRLPKLERLGLIERPARQLATSAEFIIDSDKGTRGRPQDIWALGDKGARLLDLTGDWSRNNRRLRAGAFAHPLAISRIFALLRVGVARGLIDIESWQGENTFRQRVAVGGRQLPIVPDATFELTTDNPIPFRAFLEVDNATEPLTRSSWEQSSFFKKCLAYEAFRTRVLRPSKRDTRVLVVTQTEPQAERLRRTAATIDDGESPLFWFTSQEHCAANSPEHFLFGEIWRTTSGESVSIFRQPEAIHRSASPAL